MDDFSYVMKLIPIHFPSISFFPIVIAFVMKKHYKTSGLGVEEAVITTGLPLKTFLGLGIQYLTASGCRFILPSFTYTHTHRRTKIGYTCLLSVSRSMRFTHWCFNLIICILALKIWSLWVCWLIKINWILFISTFSYCKIYFYTVSLATVEAYECGTGGDKAEFETNRKLLITRNLLRRITKWAN